MFLPKKTTKTKRACRVPVGTKRQTRFFTCLLQFIVLNHVLPSLALSVLSKYSISSVKKVLFEIRYWSVLILSLGDCVVCVWNHLIYPDKTNIMQQVTQV